MEIIVRADHESLAAGNAVLRQQIVRSSSKFRVVGPFFFVSHVAYHNRSYIMIRIKIPVTTLRGVSDVVSVPGSSSVQPQCRAQIDTE